MEEKSGDGLRTFSVVLSSHGIRFVSFLNASSGVVNIWFPFSSRDRTTWGESWERRASLGRDNWAW
jgi:hypothetical protein